MAEDSVATAISSRRSSSDASSDKSTAAQATFDIAELLDMILSYLDPLDIVIAGGINRRATALVKGSKALRQATNLSPEPDSNFLLPFLGHDSNDYYLLQYGKGFPSDAKAVEDEGSASSYDVSFTMYVGWKTFDGIFTNMRLPVIAGMGCDVLFCQPPLSSARLRPTCCGHLECTTQGYDHPQTRDRTGGLTGQGADADEEAVYAGDPRKLVSRTGITIGDVLVAANQLRRGHQQCWAQKSSLTTKGLDKQELPGVVVDLTLPLSAEDPLVKVETEEKTKPRILFHML